MPISEKTRAETAKSCYIERVSLRRQDFTRMHQNCHECTRLWSEYALATRHFLKLEGRLQIAGVSQDRKTIAELTPLLERATAERSELHRLIQEHERLPQIEAATA